MDMVFWEDIESYCLGGNKVTAYEMTKRCLKQSNNLQQLFYVWNQATGRQGNQLEWNGVLAAGIE